LTDRKKGQVLVRENFNLYKLFYSFKLDYMEELKQTNPRRDFLGTIAASAAALGIASIGSPLHLAAEPKSPFNYADDADAWFNKINGKKHKIVFDVVEPGDPFIMPFAWSKVFILTNGATGTAEKDTGVVVILRHAGIPFAFDSPVWEKYKFGEMFKVNDPKTKAPSVRNPLWKPATGDYVMPGFGNLDIGVNQLQDNGVMFCVCNAAMTVYSAVAAGMMNMNADDVKKEWTAGLLPGVQIVPSGVWAVGRAQEHGCAYCYAG